MVELASEPGSITGTAHPLGGTIRTTEPPRCAQCGRALRPRRSTRKWCGDPCKQAAYRDRRSGASRGA